MLTDKQIAANRRNAVYDRAVESVTRIIRELYRQRPNKKVVAKIAEKWTKDIEAVRPDLKAKRL